MLLMLALVLVALCSSWVAWWFMRPLLQDDVAPSTQGMPLWWRLAWPWIAVAAQVAGPLCSWRARGKVTQAIAQAALPLGVHYAHIAALRWGMAGLGAMSGAAAIQPFASLQGVVSTALVSAVLASFFPMFWLHSLAKKRRTRLDRELPFVFDMMTLCVESGLSMHGALQQSARNGPEGPLRDELFRALADMRAGMPRAVALKALADRSASAAVRSWVAALAQADALGMSLGPMLRAQAAQCRSERFQRAERLAMEAPVKMLLPLIGCIFPCTFIVLGFPIVVGLMQAVQ